MDYCPHGARLDVAPGHLVVFVDPCAVCEALLRDLGAESSVVPAKDFAFV
jgi:hypothetical protein